MRRITLANASLLSALAAAVLLTACSGPSPVSPSPSTSTSGSGSEQADLAAVYEFTREPPGLVRTLTVAIPDDLRTAAASDADGLAVNSVTLTPHELSGVKYCAVNLAIDWAPGALELANKPAMTQADVDAEVKRWTDSFLQYFDVQTIDEWVQLAEQARSDPQAAERFGSGMSLADRNHRYAGNVNHALSEQGVEWTPRLFLDKMNELILEEASLPADKATEATPEANVAREALGKPGSTYPLAELSESSPEPGLYLAPDFATGVNVQRCAAHPMDKDAEARFNFLTVTPDGSNKFAFFTYTVMSDGSITVIKADVEDYQRDFNQNWIAK